MPELVNGNFNQWSPEGARQKALAQAAQRSGQMQGYLNQNVDTRPEFDWQQQANDTGIRADTITQESAYNAGNNSVVTQINDAMAQQQAAAQAALDAQAASLNTGGLEGAQTPRIGAYLRALRQNNEMDVNDRTLEGDLGTYGMSADVLQNQQGENAGGWDKQALGYDVTPDEFLNSRKMQNQIARYKFGKYLNKQGETGALTKWHQKSNSPDSLQQFLEQIMSQVNRG